MADKMLVLLDSLSRDLCATLAAYGQRPDLNLVRALRAKLAVSLNTARLHGMLHANDPRAYASPALPESEALGASTESADTQPMHRGR